MSTISIADVKKLAQLSALNLSDDQISHMQSELDAILGYIDHLSEVDTTDTLPTYQVTGLENVMREDVVASDVVPHAELLKNTPLTEKGQIKVPRVIE